MKTTCHYQGRILIIAMLMDSTSVMGIGGAESMDRPSARPLPPLNAAPKENTKDFILPKILETSPDSEFSSDSRFFIFSNIILEGNTTLPEITLQTLVQPYVGRKVNIAELEELRQKLTQLYIDEGYINSGAIIPTDAIVKDTLHIKIIEGQLDEINIKGLGRLREGYIKNRLQDDPDKPFNLKHLQESFQLLLADPLINQMKGHLLPGASSGHSVLDLDVIRAQPYDLTLFGDNYRPPSIGGEAFGLTGQIYNLTGLGDAFDFTFIKSEGSTRYAGGFNVPINDWGTQAYFHFDEGESVVIEQPIQKLNIESQVHNLEWGFSHLLINTLNQQFNVGLQLAIRENETTLSGVPFSFVPGEPTGRNQATVWRTFQYYMHRWERQAFALRSTFNIGMDALGATPKTSNDFPSSEFFSWLGQAQYAYRVLDDGTQVVFRGNAQLSNSPLLPLERISIGGVGTVRGYRENHLVTDNGFSLSTEFHWPLIGGSEANSKHRLTIIPFVDYGEAWNNSTIAPTSQRQLFSVGVGFNWQYKPVALDLYYGYAINRPKPHGQGDLQDEAIHFQVRVDAL
jgi:hemolysin activation/secretion protein